MPRAAGRPRPLISLFSFRSPLSVGLAAAIAALVAVTLAYPFSRVGDDSLFYLTIARHLVHGDGFTFTGRTATNGFQPLWQLIVAAVVWVLDAIGIHGDAGQLRGVIVVCWVLLGATLFVLDGLLVRLRAGGPSRLLAAALLLAYLGGPLSLVASEAYVTALALAVTLVLAARLLTTETSDDRDAASFGLALGVLMLARLDCVFVAGALVAVVTLDRLRRTVASVRPAAVTVAVASIVVLPYLAINQAAFGHLEPIGGALKVDLGHRLYDYRALGAIGLGLPIVLVALAGTAFVGRRGQRVAARLAAALVVASALSTAFYIAGAQRRQVDWAWYFVPAAVGVALCAAATADRVSAPGRGRVRVRRSIVTATIVVILLGLAALAVRVTRAPQIAFASSTGRFARQVASVVPAGQLLAAVDRPGILAYAGRRGVVAIDGLTLDYAFQHRLARVGVACTLQEMGVHAIVTFTDQDLRPVDPQAPYVLQVVAWLTGKPAGTIRLRPSQRMLVGGEPSLTLWRLEPARC